MPIDSRMTMKPKLQQLFKHTPHKLFKIPCPISIDDLLYDCLDQCILTWILDLIIFWPQNTVSGSCFLLPDTRLVPDSQYVRLRLPLPNTKNSHRSQCVLVRHLVSARIKIIYTHVFPLAITSAAISYTELR